MSDAERIEVSVISADDFETGDLSAWSSSVTDGGDLRVITQTAIAGSYSLVTEIDDNNPIYVTDKSPESESRYRARFYFDPNFASLSAIGQTIFQAYPQGGTGVARLRLRNNVGDMQICLEGMYYLYGYEYWMGTPWITIQYQLHALEIEWQAATGAEASDGVVRLWIDGVKVGELLTLNDYSHSVDYVRLGAVDGISNDTRGALLFDAFDSRQNTYIGLDAGISIPPPSEPGDAIFADGFESGDLSAWSQSVTGYGDLSVTTTAAYTGTYGMQALINDNGSIYVTDWRPSEEKHYRARFYFDPNSITMGSSNSHDVFVGYNRSNTDIFRIDFAYYSPGNYGVRAIARLDSPMYRTTLYSVIDDSPHAIELEWVAATSAGANDGVIKLWIDGVEKTSLQDLDNDTHQIDYVRFGAVSGIDTGTRGTYYFDAFESTRESYIGILASRQGVTVAKSGEVNRLGSLFLAIKNFVQAIWKPAQVEHNEPDVVDLVLAPEKSPALLAHNEAMAAGSAASLGLLGAGDILTTTITYSYDALSRLTDADYSSGEFFEYSYDAVGNRLSEITASGTTTYTYDTANRLAYVSGEPYTWDDNGNLLSDGVYTYTYNSANRLIEVDWQEGTASYAYNGQGDRLQQTIGITTTNYTLDLAAGLTQVLDDGDVYLPVRQWTHRPIRRNWRPVFPGRRAWISAAGCGFKRGSAVGAELRVVW